MHLRLFAVALAEMRSARRLVRTWLFFFLASATGLVTYVYYGVIHALGSGYMVTTGMIVSPKMLSVFLGGTMLLILQLCLVFLAFDVRARDLRDRIHEVLDSRPVSNLELIIGRTLGLTVLAWTPILAIAVVMLALGAMAVELGWWISDVEPVSFAATALVDVPVSLLQWCALIVLLSVTLRNRLVVAIAGLGLAGLFSWAATATPLYLTPIFGFGPNLLPSDLVPVFLDGTAVAQRLASLAVSAGLLVVAAVMYPRMDGASRSLRLATGAALVGAGAAGLAGIGMSAAGDLADREHWANVHRPFADQPRADVEHLTASVIVEPGDYLRLDVEVTLRPASGTANDLDLVFSFNPGMDIETLSLDGKEVDFSHESGLLIVRPHSPLEGPLTLSLAATGIPDTRFAYLDSAVDAGRVSGNQASIAQLGTQASLFDDDYVALMPVSAGFPYPGRTLATTTRPGAGTSSRRTSKCRRRPDGQWRVPVNAGRSKAAIAFASGPARRFPPSPCSLRRSNGARSVPAACCSNCSFIPRTATTSTSLPTPRTRSPCVSRRCSTPPKTTACRIPTMR